MSRRPQSVPRFTTRKTFAWYLLPRNTPSGSERTIASERLVTTLATMYIGRLVLIIRLHVKIIIFLTH